MRTLGPGVQNPPQRHLRAQVRLTTATTKGTSFWLGLRAPGDIRCVACQGHRDEYPDWVGLRVRGPEVETKVGGCLPGLVVVDSRLLRGPHRVGPLSES